jgi:hypothetical protein
MASSREHYELVRTMTIAGDRKQQTYPKETFGELISDRKPCNSKLARKVQSAMDKKPISSPGATTDKKPISSPGVTSEREHVEELLDEALMLTFPASDPVAITIERADARRPMQPTKNTKSTGTE